MTSKKPPSWNQIRNNARKFALRFKDAFSEKAEGHEFMRGFLEVFGVDPVRAALYEQHAQRASKGGALGYIDMLWPGVLLWEMKSRGEDLARAEAQALDYLDSLDDFTRPSVVITSDFEYIRIIDLADTVPQSFTFKTSDLALNAERFAFVAGYQQRRYQTPAQEVEANVKAAAVLGRIYEHLAEDNYDEHQSSVLLVRLLFLLFGDDTGMWDRGILTDFLTERTAADGSDLGGQLVTLFSVLDTEENRRSKNLDEYASRFPYANGGLFSERIDPPSFTKEGRQDLLDACGFDWSQISPAIFGSLFQSVKSKEMRRELGEHYTSEQNILRLIQPLFLDELRDRFDKAQNSAQTLKRIQSDMSKMRFFDPACGCGNFLVITYRELRRLDVRIKKRIFELEQTQGTQTLAVDTTLDLAVSLDQFYGIEIEEWPARIAETAMLLVDQQMNIELSAEFGEAPDRLPISDKNIPNIKIGNALHEDWASVVTPTANVITLGNPPFVGRKYRTAEQVADMQLVWGKSYNANIDFVACWHILANRFYGDALDARWGFVSTNSVAQGEQAAKVFEPIFANGWRVRFAHRSLKWDSEAPGKAGVDVSLIGFDKRTAPKPRLWIYDSGKEPVSSEEVNRINAYLIEGPNVLVKRRSEPLSAQMPIVAFGSMPNDGGALIVEPEDHAEAVADPIAARYVRPLVGSEELVNNGRRWCLWLKEAAPGDIRKSPFLKKRVEACRTHRLDSKNPDTIARAATPHLFWHDAQPKVDYLCIPSVVSEKRPFITAAHFTSDVIASNLAYVAEDLDGYLFAMLSSSMFVTWQKAIGGRLESRIRFTARYSFNSFPLPDAKKPQREAVIFAGKEILAIRKVLGGSLAQQYDPLSMSPELLKAHTTLDKAVDKIFTSAKMTSNLDRERILFRTYAKLTGQKISDQLF